MNERWKIILSVLGGAVAGITVAHLFQQSQREVLPAPSGRARALLPDTHFYTCQTAAGDPEAGRTPGAIEVVPAERPNVSLEKVAGSGFNEVRQFLRQMESAEKWRDLFLATSPSRGDKTNVLLVGPQGCGKTEVLRAVASNSSYAAIFARGADFLTCWAGEASKNPGRLFEAAKGIHTRTGKRVFILIDEIDQILHSDTMMGDKSLAREFQVLMDGILDYPMISVWGATNFPGRIPQPMMRRFTMVLIVGELDQRDRVQLLQQFCGNMSVAGFTDDDWERLARRLDGATGDVIRKMIEPVSRAKMQAFVEEHRDVAEMLRSWIDREGGPRALQDDAKRAEFDALLAEHVKITPEDLDASISTNLSNLAILSQIHSARETYAEARRLLRDMQDANS